MDTNTQMQNRPQTFMSALNTNTRLHTHRYKTWAVGTHPKERKKSVSLTSQAVIFCAPTVTRLCPQGRLYGNQGHSEPLTPPKQRSGNRPIWFHMDLCQRASQEASVTEVMWKVCQAETAGERGSTGGSVPNVPSCRDFCTCLFLREERL